MLRDELEDFVARTTVPLVWLDQENGRGDGRWKEGAVKIRMEGDGRRGIERTGLEGGI